MIDILLPFYGEPALLRLAVESVLAQTSPDWRLVVVDDAYPDRSVARWIEALGDARVEYHRNEVNLGVNANFQRCLELARAPWSVFLGCDDLLLPTYVETVAVAASGSGADVVQPGVEVIDRDGRPCRGTTDLVKALLGPSEGGELLAGEDLARSLLVGAWTYFPAMCWRTEAIARIGFRPGLDTALDLDLLLEVVVRGGAMLRLPDVLFRYRRHGASASGVARTRLRFDEEHRLFADWATRLSAHGWPRASRAARVHLTSRLHAASLIPSAVVREPRAARMLLHHAVR